jgi:hypothetical protein
LYFDGDVGGNVEVCLRIFCVVDADKKASTFESGLLNGGPAGLIYGFLYVWIGTFLQAAVMGEMASM